MYYIFMVITVLGSLLFAGMSIRYSFEGT